MLCPKCKTENSDSANFCTNCRESLKKSEAAAPAKETKTSTNKIDFVAILTGIFVKPMTTLKEQLPKFADFKNASIITLIVVAAMTILSTITTVVGVVRTEECVENCSVFSSKSEKKKIETKWKWDNLEDFDWFKNVGQTFLMNLVTVVIISGAYFGMSKAFKSKDANFFRMTTVVALGFIPSAAAAFVAPIIGGINLTLGGIVALAGSIYTLSIIFIGLNGESGLEGDKKVYLNIASIACMILAYYVIIRLIYGELAGKVIEGLIQSAAGGGINLSSSSSIDLNDLF